MNETRNSTSQQPYTMESLLQSIHKIRYMLREHPRHHKLPDAILMTQEPYEAIMQDFESSPWFCKDTNPDDVQIIFGIPVEVFIHREALNMRSEDLIAHGKIPGIVK